MPYISCPDLLFAADTFLNICPDLTWMSWFLVLTENLKKLWIFSFKLALFSGKAKFILFSNSTDARSRDVSISPTYNDDIANFIKNLERITITSPPSPASYLNPWMFFILFLLKTFWHLRHTNQSIIRSPNRISYMEF